MLKKIIKIIDKWALHSLDIEPGPTERRLLRIGFLAFVIGGVPAIAAAIEVVVYGFRFAAGVIIGIGTLLALVGSALQFIANYRMRK